MRVCACTCAGHGNMCNTRVSRVVARMSVRTRKRAHTNGEQREKREKVERRRKRERKRERKRARERVPRDACDGVRVQCV